MDAGTVRRRFRASLVSGLAFGGGLALGSVIMQLLFILFSWLEPSGLDESTRFAWGVLLVFAIAMTGGAIGGFAGGWTYPVAGHERGRFGYAWRSAFSFGLPYGTVLYLLVFIIYATAIGDRTGAGPGQAAALFAILGGALGLVYGLVLGLVTVGRRFLRVLLAALTGFALGGAGLGLAMRAFLGRLPVGALASEGPYWIVLLGLFAFGLAGGAALGFAYDVLAHDIHERRPLSRTWKVAIGVVSTLLVLLLSIRLWGLIGDLRLVLMPRDANLSPILDTRADGTHWSYAENAPTGPSSFARQAAVAAHGPRLVAMAWVEGEGAASTLFYAPGAWQENARTVAWEAPVALPGPSGGAPAFPHVALDAGGRAHLLWLEAGRRMAYAHCDGSTCSDSMDLSALSEFACDGGANYGITGASLALAVDSSGVVLGVWGTPAGNLSYATWPVANGPSSPVSGCLRAAGGEGVFDPRLAAGVSSHSLIYSHTQQPGGSISVRRFTGGEWQPTAQVVGNGSTPDIWTSADGGTHAAWCAPGGSVMYWDGATTELVTSVDCSGRPAVAMDGDGRVHIAFASDTVANRSGLESSRDVLYESIQAGEGWTGPMIVSLPEGRVQPAMAASSEGVLHLAWTGTSGAEGAGYATQRQYSCEGYELTGAAGAVLEVSQWPAFRSPDSSLAYCQNRYDGLVYAPNPAPGFSAEAPTTGGAFDALAGLASTARYEVLVATMAYEKAVNGAGPGIVIGRAVKALYDRVRADPNQYPRGLTMRILLGNSPPFTTMELDSQLWELLGDLREAGVETMVDPEIGWRLEVANFEGAYPHSHTKLMVVDGRSMIASGFNIEHRPMPVDYPSGKGKGDTDLGIQVTGPAAQDGRRVFDELWDGAVQRHCSDFYPAFRIWQATCRDRAAEVGHVPEVLRYYLPGGESIALSMFRSDAHQEADEEVYAALSSAQERIDVLHVSFTYSILCALNHFFDLCTVDQAPEYIQRISEAVLENGASARILVGVLPFQGVENVVAVDLLRRAVEEQGLGDRVEFRFFDGLVHAKSFLVDDAFLVVGSQNFHYSAFGDGALAEYSIGTTDPQAIADYRRLFDYLWDRAKP